MAERGLQPRVKAKTKILAIVGAVYTAGGAAPTLYKAVGSVTPYLYKASASVSNGHPAKFIAEVFPWHHPNAAMLLGALPAYLGARVWRKERKRAQQQARADEQSNLKVGGESPAVPVLEDLPEPPRAVNKSKGVLGRLRRGDHGRRKERSPAFIPTGPPTYTPLQQSAIDFADYEVPPTADHSVSITWDQLETAANLAMEGEVCSSGQLCDQMRLDRHMTDALIQELQARGILGREARVPGAYPRMPTPDQRDLVNYNLECDRDMWREGNPRLECPAARFGIWIHYPDRLAPNPAAPSSEQSSGRTTGEWRIPGAPVPGQRTGEYPVPVERSYPAPRRPGSHSPGR